MRPNGSQETLEKRRWRAADLLKQGLNLSEVAAKVGSSVSSVFRWQTAVRKDGRKALKSQPVPGRPSKLNGRQRRQLTRILLAGAMSCGYATDLWTQKRVARVIEDRLGIRYHRNHMWRLLQDLGWSVQKPTKRSRERDEKAIAHWKRYVWPHIKKGRTA
jgi:transposase